MKAVLSSSRLKVARMCQRLHHFMYVLLYRPAEDADVLRFGSLIHLGLEAWWRATSNRLEAALAAVAGEADPFDLVRAEEMLRGYHYRWVGEAARYEVLAVECEFRTPLRNPETGASSRTWVLGGKIDVVVRDVQDGRVLVVEHKTSSEDIRPGSKYWRRLRMDGQVSMYYEGAASLGHEVDGCLYDVLGKPSIRPLMATPQAKRKFRKDDGALYAGQREHDETPEEFRARLVEDIASNPEGYYQRGEVVRLEDEMAEALGDIWQVAQQVREAQLADRAPRNPDACEPFGRTCPFFGVCTGQASLDDEKLFRRSETAHPELSAALNDEEKEQPTQEVAV